MMKKVLVQFGDEFTPGKEYAYLTDETNLEKGDLVVVEARDWYQVARFVRYVNSEEGKKATKFIVQKVDVEELAVKKDKAEGEKEIRQKIQFRIKELEEEEQMRALAEQDDTLKELIGKLEDL